MKKMKKLLVVLMALVMLALVAAPAGVAAAKSLPAVSSLTISTGKKAKQLVLKWKGVSDAYGYEIWRSTTGKTGSYKLVTGIGGTTYTDTGLKHSTPYYYAVRAWSRNGSKTIYSAFKKVNLSTRITKTYASSRFAQVYKAMHKIKNACDKDAVEKGTAIEKTIEGWYGYYLPYTFKGITTKTDVVNLMSKYVEKKLAKDIANTFFKAIKGKLYVWMPQDPGEYASLVINDIPTQKLSYSDKKVVCKFGTWFASFGDEMNYSSVKLSMVYEGGRWVFADDDYWYSFTFPYTTMITPGDGRGPDEY